MGYHVDTGLIYEKFTGNCDCPLCEIQQIVEEQFLHEFLNDAVMEDNTRIKVGKKGFCAKHFDMLFARPNKLSVALQVRTRLENIYPLLCSSSNQKKVADQIIKSVQTCAICDFVDQSMIKYYKTIAQMYLNEKEFYKTLLNVKGFCANHYAQLIKYANYAGLTKKNYLNVLSTVQKRSLDKILDDLKTFCDKHDYRNAMMPLGDAEYALPNARTKLYGKKYD